MLLSRAHPFAVRPSRERAARPAEQAPRARGFVDGRRTQERVMNLEDRIIQVLREEFERQAQNRGDLKVGPARDSMLEVHGAINLDDLAMSIAGALAGGP
jgi:hypothetical protein